MIIKVVQDGGRQIVKVYERGLFTQGGAPGSTTADQVPLNPSVAGLPATVQGAIQELNNSISVVAPVPIGGHRAVTLTGVGVQYADSTVLNFYAIGITTEAASAQSSLSIKTSGRIVESSWNWTVSQFIFLGQNGLLTQVPPSPPALFSQVVGIADSPTSMLVNINSPIVFS